MACQAGIGPLDYSEWDRQRDLYFAAIRAGAVLNVTPMEDLFKQVLLGGLSIPEFTLDFSNRLTRFDGRGTGHRTDDARTQRQ